MFGMAYVLTFSTEISALVQQMYHYVSQLDYCHYAIIAITATVQKQLGSSIFFKQEINSTMS